MAIVPIQPVQLPAHVSIGDKLLKLQQADAARKVQQQTIDMNNTQIQEAARKALETKGYNAAIAGGGTPEEITSRVQKVGAGAYTDWTEHLGKMESERIAQEKNKVDMLKAHTEVMAKYADSILSKDEEDRPLIYKHILLTMTAAGDPLAKNLPPEYDENVMNQFIEANKKLEEYGKQLDNQAKEAEAKRKAQDNYQKDVKFESDQTKASLDAEKARAEIAGTLPTDDMKEFSQSGYYRTYLKENGIDPSTLNKDTEQEVRGKAFIAFKQAQLKDAAPTEYSLALKAAKGDPVKALQIANSSKMDNVDLSPEALDMAALKFAKTGDIVALGMGNASAATKRKVLNRAAELYPGIDIASNQADYVANRDSLKKLQASQDMVVAFENTANKNLDLFLNSAKKVVDSGSQWINKPLRAVDQGALGASDLAAFNAARQVAINEIAKVTSNPGLSGQLSDSARKEVEAFIPQDATLEQIYKVAAMLKADMKNRHESNADQLKAIQDRISTKPKGKDTGTATVDTAKPATATAPAGTWKVIR